MGNITNIDKFGMLPVKAIKASYVKRNYLIDRSEARNNAHPRNGDFLRFDSYSLTNEGILDAKPPVDYRREIEGKKGPLFGVELEIEQREDSDGDPDDYDEEDQSIDRGRLKKILKPLAGHYYCCEDGSLRQGVEIVFAPSSVTGWRSRYVAIHKVLQRLSETGYISHQSGRCGLHIHVSRERGFGAKRIGGYTQEQAGRAESFVLEWSDFFQRISRRENFQYCSFDRTSGRYRAVNTCPGHTLEFRFFRGTLVPASFFGALETIFALTDYMQQERRSYTFPSFVKLLKTYPLAWKYVSARAPEMTKPGYVKRLTEARRALEAQRAEERRRYEIEHCLDNLRSNALRNISDSTSVVSRWSDDTPREVSVIYSVDSRLIPEIHRRRGYAYIYVADNVAIHDATIVICDRGEVILKCTISGGARNTLLIRLGTFNFEQFNADVASIRETTDYPGYRDYMTVARPTETPAPQPPVSAQVPTGDWAAYRVLVDTSPIDVPDYANTYTVRYTTANNS